MCFVRVRGYAKGKFIEVDAKRNKYFSLNQFPSTNDVSSFTIIYLRKDMGFFRIKFHKLIKRSEKARKIFEQIR